MSVWFCAACNKLLGFEASMKCPICGGSLSFAEVKADDNRAEQTCPLGYHFWVGAPERGMKCLCGLKEWGPIR